MKKALVVGAGPAGLSAAMGLVKIGFETIALEQWPERKPRVCGSFLNAEAVTHLHWLNVAEDLHEAGAVPVLQTRVTAPGQSEIFVSSRQNNVTGLALPRPVLETCISQKALKEGVQIHFGSRVTEFKKEKEKWLVQTRDMDGRLHNHFADLMVLADGRFSLSLGSRYKAHAGWYGWNASYSQVPQKPGNQSLHFFPGGYVGVMTYQDGSTNVCGLVYKNSPTTKIGDDVLKEAESKSPALKFLLEKAKRTSEWMGVGPLPYSLWMRNRKDVLLAGDAAAVGDPFMGEGIGRALGAGPMMASIYKRLHSKGNPSIPNFIQTYNAVWKKNYTSRLWIGFFARRFLNGLLPFKWGMASMRNKTVMNFITPFFHKGFSSQ